MNIDILGISKLKWTGMGEFTSEWVISIVSTTVGKNTLEEIEQPTQSTKESEMQYFSAKQQNDLCLSPRQTIQYHGNPRPCPNQYAEEAEVEWFYEDLQDLLELTPKQDVLFIIGDWNAQEVRRYLE